MPRFGLLNDWDDEEIEVAAVDSKQAATAQAKQSKHRLVLLDDSDEDEDDNSDLDYSEDDDDEEEDDENLEVTVMGPLISRTGSTRYTIDRRSTAYSLVAPYFCKDSSSPEKSVRLKEIQQQQQQQRQQYPPLSSYHDGETAPTAALRRLALVASSCRMALGESQNANEFEYDEDDDMVQLAQMLQSSSIYESPLARSRTRASPQRRPMLQHQQHNGPALTLTPLHVVQQDLRNEQDQAAAALRSLLQDYSNSASKILAAEARQNVEQQQAQDEQERLEQEQAEAEHAAAQAAEDERKKQEAAAAAKRETALKQQAAATEYLTRATKLRAQLIDVQKSVAIFDSSKLVGKRRLNMKKIVNGRVNTLAENVDKIRSVATEVLQAVALARQEDAAAKEQPSSPPEMALGKRYLLNLLASNVIVRVQAEGFNGQRGDGFPLANMLALVSIEAKDFVPVMTAHIFSVCPTAIPTLPQASEDDVSEEALMTSLGMLRLANGDFESFERFLSRTEGVMSLVANIMASEPSSHGLMGGHEGAVKWLKRFLALLPAAPQAPLPLITAPVLDAFLTGAGHMLARIHATEFATLLDAIVKDIATRLDESSIGMPSATRLRKTIRDGFDGFKNQLPSRALSELYHGATPGSDHHGSAATASATGANAGASSSTTSALHNPFGPPSTTSSAHNLPGFAPSQGNNASPFGRPPLATSEKSAFGTGTSATTAPSPFGPTLPNSFGTAASSNSSSPFLLSKPSQSSPFGSAPEQTNSFTGSTTTAAPSPSLFGTTPASSPFQQASPFAPPTAPSPSPFGNPPAPAPSPFGTTTATSSSPFGVSAPAPSMSPFGTSTPFGTTQSVAPQSSPFGTQNQPSPFGQPPSGQPQSSPFGAQPAQTQPSPFGVPQPQSQTSPFGVAAQSQPSPFGTSQAQSQPSPFGAASSPFGAAPTQPSPFGATQAPAPFGTQSAPSPFGLPQQSSTPFGNTQQQSSPFGSSSSPFGSSQQQTTLFGAPQQPTNDGRPPCKFFAQGRCKFGDKCQNSHALPNNSFASPFSGPRR